MCQNYGTPAHFYIKKERIALLFQKLCLILQRISLRRDNVITNKDV